MLAEEVLISSITESKTNPRTHFDESGLIELAENIKLVGVLQPVILRPIENDTYELVAGARRFRSSKIAGLTQIPANIRNLTDLEVLEIQIAENLQRENINPMDEARSFDNYFRIKKSVHEISHIICKSEKFVYQRIALVRLIAEAQDLVSWGQLPLHHAYKISALEEKKQAECLKHMVVRDADRTFISVRTLQELNWWIRNNSIKDLNNAPFDLKDKNLCIEAGACIGCVKRTSVNLALFEEYTDENKCLDPVCYDKKIKAHVDTTVSRLNDKGVQPVLISDAPYGQSKTTLGQSAYEFKEPKKQCESCQLAVIVHSDKGNEGKQVHICVHAKCPSLKEEYTPILGVVEDEKVTPQKLQRDKLIVQISRNDIITNHFPTERAGKFIKAWAMFYNLASEFQQRIVDSLNWTIDWGEGPYGHIDDTTAEQFFFENFNGSEVHVQIVERMYIIEMFLAIDKEGKSGYELQDAFMNENITSFMVKAEKAAGKIADKLIALHGDNPDRKDLKNVSANDLMLAFQTENDMIMLADKLGMTLDIKEDTTLLQIANTIITWKQS